MDYVLCKKMNFTTTNAIVFFLQSEGTTNGILTLCHGGVARNVAGILFSCIILLVEILL